METFKTLISCDSCDRKLAPLAESYNETHCLYCRRIESSPLFKPKKITRANRAKFEAEVLYALLMCEALEKENGTYLYVYREVLKRDDNDTEYSARFARRMGADITISYRDSWPRITLKKPSHIHELADYWGISLKEQHRTNIYYRRKINQNER